MLYFHYASVPISRCVICILITGAAVNAFVKSQILLFLYSYSLEQTEQFLNCVLEADPVKTVIAQESVQQNELGSYSAAKSREKKVFLFLPLVVTNKSKAMLMETPCSAYLASTLQILTGKKE